jgi:hypothetical protein
LIVAFLVKPLSRPMKLALLLPLMTLLTVTSVDPLQAQRFSFSQPDDADKQEQAARDARIADALSAPCRADLKNKKIMVVIGERQSNGYVEARQQNYGEHYQAINKHSACAPTRRRKSGARSRKPRSTPISATTPTRRCRRRDASARASCCAASSRRRRRPIQ